MRQVITAVLPATLGEACRSASGRAAAPAAPQGQVQRVLSHHHEPAGVHDSHRPGGPHHAFADADALTHVFDDPTRDEWQRPGDVLRALELEPTMSVADLGAGTGYFAVRLARAVPEGEVIATDIEPDMLRFLQERARRERLLNLRAVRATATASGLTAQSVDRVLVVHVWHHVADRGALTRDLATALRPGGRVLIVDFEAAARRGPLAGMRVAPEDVIAGLESAGLSARILPIALPDQYVVEARRRP